MSGNKKEQECSKFVDLGIKVVPLKANTKNAILKDWPKYALADPVQIQAWFTDNPDINYGLLMGNGFAVLDVDVHNGKDGFATLASIQKEDLPQTLTVKTPSGGMHFYFRTEDNLPSRKLTGDIDFKAGRGYVVGPGSVIDGEPYETIDPSPIASIPEWLVDAVTQKNQRPEGLKVSGQEFRTFKALECKASDIPVETIQRHLANINPDLPHDDWLKAMYAVINIWGMCDQTVGLLNEWSMQGGKYDEDVFWKKIRSFDPDHKNKVGLTTLKQIQIEYPASTAHLPYSVDATPYVESVINNVVAILEQSGNKPSGKHLDALGTVCHALVNGVFDKDRTFRIAFPLETGMGKTTAILALAKELQHTDKSLLIAAERIEQLGELHAAMIKEGVSDSRIGIFHSSEKDHPDILSTPLDQIDQVQFLLVSHNRIKADSTRFMSERLNRYQGQKRDLVIWDESLLTSNGYSITLEELVRAASDWRTGLELKLKAGHRSPKQPEIFEELYKFLGQALENLNEPNSLVTFPVLSASSENYSKAIKMICDIHGRNNGYQESLKRLIEYSQRGEARIVNTQMGEVLVQFVQTVEDDLDRIVILDASARIRDLVQFDPTVQTYPLQTSKDYSSVTIKWADILSSKASFDDQAHIENYLSEAEQILGKEIPANEPLLIITHKELKDSIRDYLNEKFPFREIHVIHWGEHRASNKFAHIKYLMTIGVLYRNRHELAANIIGQTRNMNYPLIDSEIRSVELSEQADLLYQGFSRGNSRKTIDGIAGEQVIYLFHPRKDAEPVFSILEHVMPGIKVEEYEPRYLKRAVHKRAIGYQEIGQAIIEYLSAMDIQTGSISIRELRRNLFPDISSNSSTWRKSLDYALKQLFGWAKEGQSLVRCPVSL